MTNLLYLIFLFLAIYDAGGMTTLQLQHYGIYQHVGRETFGAYMRANNRAAAIPTIVPALLLLLSSCLIVFLRPSYMRPYEAVAALVLNVAALASTFRWQRPIQARMADTGYDAEAIERLIRTNWIRTVSHLLIALIALMPVVRVLAERR